MKEIERDLWSIEYHDVGITGYRAVWLERDSQWIYKLGAKPGSSKASILCKISFNIL